MISCPPVVLEAIIEHARREAPRECCGLLVGRDDRIIEAHPLENRAADPTRRYEIDPRDFLTILKRCRGTPNTVIGAYHSHPRSPAEPSASDRAEAFDGFLYVIVGGLSSESCPQMRAYRWQNGNFRAVTLVPDAKETET